MSRSQDRFDGQVAVITGVGRPGQAGEAVAAHFASLGAHLVLLDRDAEGVEAQAAALRAAGARANAHPCNLAEPGAVATVANEVAQVYRGVQALVCLAGGFGATGGVGESAPELWEKMFTINLSTAVYTTQAFLPLLRPVHGAIVYFASASVLPGGKTGGMSAYAASKAAVVSLMQSVAQEERTSGVRANALAPTAIRTASNTAAMSATTTYVERETVAEWTAMLCSQTARNINGQVIRLA